MRPAAAPVRPPSWGSGTLFRPAPAHDSTLRLGSSPCVVLCSGPPRPRLDPDIRVESGRLPRPRLDPKIVVASGRLLRPAAARARPPSWDCVRAPFADRRGPGSTLKLGSNPGAIRGSPRPRFDPQVKVQPGRLVRGPPWPRLDPEVGVESGRLFCCGPRLDLQVWAQESFVCLRPTAAPCSIPKLGPGYPSAFFVLRWPRLDPKVGVETRRRRGPGHPIYNLQTSY